MDLYKRASANGADPDTLVIFLHGLGANGQDLIGIAQYWADQFPGALFLSPDAPEPCDMAPAEAAQSSRQWFSLQNQSPEAIAHGVKKASLYLNAFLDHHLEENTIPPERLALVGFSQGAMLGLFTALKRKAPLACFLGYSGALAGINENGDINSKPPVFLWHGEDDMVVPVQAYHQTKKALEAMGVPVTGQTVSGLAHSIDEKGIEKGGEFLSQYLAM